MVIYSDKLTFFLTLDCDHHVVSVMIHVLDHKMVPRNRTLQVRLESVRNFPSASDTSTSDIQIRMCLGERESADKDEHLTKPNTDPNKVCLSGFVLGFVYGLLYFIIRFIFLFCDSCV